MTLDRVREIVYEGLWHNNQALVALLGLCPLLAVTNNAINGLGLGLATLAVLLVSNVLVSLIRDFVPREVRIPIFIGVIATAVTIIEMLMAAYLHELHLLLGIFVPLIVTNCVILGRAEAFASKNPVWAAALDGLAMGLGFLIILVILGGMRELLAQGTLFDQAWLMFGETARDWTLYLIHLDEGLLLAALPPGAFLGLGLLVALKNWIELKKQSKHQPLPLTPNHEPEKA
ncbi:MAG TPA: electron transport complex subunit E [Piscirickettsiaceae bacterium]|nr:electron transport complex subunit E [Piscirickettsiaceae bacterium]